MKRNRTSIDIRNKLKKKWEIAATNIQQCIIIREKSDVRAIASHLFSYFFIFDYRFARKLPLNLLRSMIETLYMMGNDYTKSICSKKFWFSKRLYEVNYANCPKQPQRTIFFIKDTFSVKLISPPLVRQFINHSFQISWLGISLILFIRVSGNAIDSRPSKRKEWQNLKKNSLIGLQRYDKNKKHTALKQNQNPLLFLVYPFTRNGYKTSSTIIVMCDIKKLLCPNNRTCRGMYGII